MLFQSQPLLGKDEHDSLMTLVFQFLRSLFCFVLTDYMCHVYVRRDSLSGVAICDHEYPSRVAFTFINKVMQYCIYMFSTVSSLNVLRKRWGKCGMCIWLMGTKMPAKHSLSVIEILKGQICIYNGPTRPTNVVAIIIKSFILTN